MGSLVAKRLECDAARRFIRERFKRKVQLMFVAGKAKAPRSGALQTLREIVFPLDRSTLND
jgi:hypothetical protein